MKTGATGDPESRVWVFNGARASFPAAVFSTRALAEAWIAEHRLSGVLTAYPLDQSVYDWVREKGFFKKEISDPALLAGFSSAHQEHYHYDDGVRP